MQNKPTENTPRVHITAAERFAAKTVPTDTGCLAYVGAHDDDGYGMFKANGKQFRAHRFAWEQAHGPIPDGLHVHHTCENPGCVNVDHLIPLTPLEHAHIHDRQIAPHAQAMGADAKRAITHCPQGHPYSGDNLHIRPCGRRGCRACDRDRHKARYHAR